MDERSGQRPKPEIREPEKNSRRDPCPRLGNRDLPLHNLPVFSLVETDHAERNPALLQVPRSDYRTYVEDEAGRHQDFVSVRFNRPQCSAKWLAVVAIEKHIPVLNSVFQSGSSWELNLLDLEFTVSSGARNKLELSI